MKKKFVIIGSTLSGNKGAAAMLESAIQTLESRFTGSTFTLLSYIPVSVESKLNTYRNLAVLKATPLYLGVVINSLAVAYRVFPFLRKKLLKNKQIKALVEADVLLDQGGITFVDGREKFLLYNVASILPALMVGTPVVKCAQALGPFKSPINKTAAKIFLPRLTAIVARGAITYKYLSQLKLKNVTNGADYAFLLDVTSKERESVKRLVKPAFFSEKKTVGVAPSVVMKKKVEAEGKDYSSILATFINQLINKGYNIVLVPHSVRTNTAKTHNNDLPLCREIFSLITHQDSCLFIDSELSSQELRVLIGKCDFFVASRFHAMVSSLAMQVPTLVIGWSHKYKEVLQMFELEKWAFGHSKLTLPYLQAQFTKLVKEETTTRKLLAKNLPIVKQRAALQVDIIEGVANSSSN